MKCLSVKWRSVKGCSGNSRATVKMQLRFDRHSVRESVVSASADCALVGNSCGVCPNKEVEREVTLQQPLRLLY